MAATPADDAAPGPLPGSLEHLADRFPDGPAVLDAATGTGLTRQEHDVRADALARALHARYAIGPGDRVGIALAPGPELLLVLFAVAKLGSAPLLLDPGLPHAATIALARLGGCTLLVAGAVIAPDPGGAPPVLSASALTALAATEPRGGEAAAAARRLSGAHAPADAVQVAAGPDGHPRLVFRSRSPERIARLAPTVGDLLARVGLPPGGVHLLGPGGHRPEPQFWAGVALVTGGSVVTLAAPGGAALLDALVTHGVTSVVLDAAALRALVVLPPARTDAADLTQLQRVLVCGGALDGGLVAAAADLLGEDVLHVVRASAQTGPVSHAGGADLAADPTGAGSPLAGIDLREGADGCVLVRSPLAADGALGDRTARGGWPAPPGWREDWVPLGTQGV